MLVVDCAPGAKCAIYECLVGCCASFTRIILTVLSLSVPARLTTRFIDCFDTSDSFWDFIVVVFFLFSLSDRLRQRDTVCDCRAGFVQSRNMYM